MALWVFAYGSLLWNPGFTPLSTVKATLADYHRSFCMLSIHHRGTEDNPGLVLALDAVAGAQCTGLALQVDPTEEDRVLVMLRERELISSAYLEKKVNLIAQDGGEIAALAYVIDPRHQQYCQMSLEDQALKIACAVGGRGPNTDYLFNTASQLSALDIADSDMDWLVTRVRALTATATR